MRLLFTAIVPLLSICAIHGQDLAASTAGHGAFAFPNKDGSSLLATAEIARPEALRTALCTNGRRVAIRFERRQAEGKASSGRQTYHNFANTKGALYRVLDGNVDFEGTCFLAADSVLSEATLVPLTRSAKDGGCSRDLYPHFESAKSRPVVACWPIAEAATGTQIVLIEFARRLKSALASLVVIDQNRSIYVDYPAEFSGPGADLWRVDDGGEIHPEGFEIVFLLKRGSSYLLGVNWGGAEGASLSVWIAENSDQFKQVIGDYWYQSPL